MVLMKWSKRTGPRTWWSKITPLWRQGPSKFWSSAIKSCIGHSNIRGGAELLPGAKRWALRAIWSRRCPFLGSP
jgi:hypothetical protein